MCHFYGYDTKSHKQHSILRMAQNHRNKGENQQPFPAFYGSLHLVRYFMTLQIFTATYNFYSLLQYYRKLK